MSRLEAAPLAPAPGWPPRFSYDAVRVPLYLTWAGRDLEPAAQAALRFWNSAPDAPAWTDLVQNSQAPYPANSGFRAIARLTSDRTVPADALPRVHQAPHCYAAALTLLSRLAAFERAFLA
ncbi:glycosyl hydrolase family 8 [Teichococcus vastitatis]|uniref:Glycosyl hydrolase family 8 n=1 Tax=Teichococcus vastitatis TaxID=2307076 RepID=A0ABS9W2M1_9PROT|nr:glycosyl hydrolase family 8 [Pseudoroseomonas vastitatis]MCI0753190.1 glycosyl hydrolase family 8 [Pseudoroseomonas vastitatis]